MTRHLPAAQGCAPARPRKVGAMSMLATGASTSAPGVPTPAGKRISIGMRIASS